MEKTQNQWHNQHKKINKNVKATKQEQQQWPSQHQVKNRSNENNITIYNDSNDGNGKTIIAFPFLLSGKKSSRSTVFI